MVFTFCFQDPFGYLGCRTFRCVLSFKSSLKGFVGERTLRVCEDNWEGRGEWRRGRGEGDC